jgi:hypothetical protein
LATRDDREGKRQVKIAQLDGECPFDRMGLIWLLNGDRLLALTADAAVVERRAVAITALDLARAAVNRQILNGRNEAE